MKAAKLGLEERAALAGLLERARDRGGDPLAALVLAENEAAHECRFDRTALESLARAARRARALILDTRTDGTCRGALAFLAAG